MSDRIPTSSPLSSLQSSEATFKTASSQATPQYRSTVALPFELQQHVQIYLQENLFSQAFRLLLGLISATVGDEKKKIPLPSPDYLAVFSTLSVHPRMTTRASNQDKLTQSNTALRALWIINKAAGPVNSHISDAFRFSRYHNRLSTINGGNEDDDRWSKKLDFNYANEESLYTLANDFWAVLGWALNCACLPGLHAARWEYWCPWLEYMLGILETDWEAREELGTLNQSLLWQYIRLADGGNVKGRRILRAVFADGSPSALNEFKSIFQKELKGRRLEKVQKQEVKVDVDEAIYGDWMQESESDTEDDRDPFRIEHLESRPSKRIRTRTPSARRRMTPRANAILSTDHEDSDSSVNEQIASVDGLGSPETISIRMRFLQLLAMVSAQEDLICSSQEGAFPDLHELYTLFVEFVRPLPLHTFQQVVLPSVQARVLRPESRTSLCEFMLQLDSGKNATKRSTFEPMTQTRLIRDYMSTVSSKSKVEYQAKVSMLIESLLRQLVQYNQIRLGDEFLDALNTGIEAREAKVREIRETVRHKRASGQDEDAAQQMLEDSGMRMRFLVEQVVD